jgi:hypothetical protein
MSMSRLGRFLRVPDSWEAWAIRVLTVAIVFVFAAAFLLGGQVQELQDFVSESRTQRTQFQQEETARQCALLEAHGLTPERLEELKC